MEMISKELEAKVMNAETLDDVVKVLAEEGIEVTKAQLEREVTNVDGGELNADDLDNVSGGAIIPWILPVLVAWYVSKRRK